MAVNSLVMSWAMLMGAVIVVVCTYHIIKNERRRRAALRAKQAKEQQFSE